eukprot:CAMPEP_0118893920 /NCGR_PEP_ID=MMETSP1166-20130328/2931_1 /TAXON_ID=1104430 /ORGANISM="Chrysoreinhardia sp, Strain CCMP3193" /LENGTH=175 /DNA_ID=CAMNT_0006832787 /DNA_START=52 /DNA_END=576 /DNA_ORIENTATION=+
MMHLVYGDTVRLAQASPRVAALLNWTKVARFAHNEVHPQRKLPHPPTTFPLHAPRLPTRMPGTAVAVLARVANLDESTTKAFRTVARAFVLTEWDLLCDGHVTSVDAIFVAVVAGFRRTDGLRYDGTIATSDANFDPTPTSAGFVAIACGGGHSVALRSDGTVVTWGRTFDGQRN